MCQLGDGAGGVVRSGVFVCEVGRNVVAELCWRGVEVDGLERWLAWSSADEVKNECETFPFNGVLC
jgi:hypothetical protein